MLADETVRACAKRLEEAERTRTQIGQFSLEFEGMTMADAYAIQQAWLDLKLKAGGVVVGHKIGLTSRAMQLAVQIDEPDYGFLLQEMVYLDGADVDSGRLIEPRIEVELAFVLNRPLAGPNCSLFDVLRATEYVVPALEILDARIERFDRQTRRPRTVLDTISDNAADCAMVLGTRARAPEEVDLRWVSGILSRNGRTEETGVAAGVLNHPAIGIAWLADRLAGYGARLEAGELVLSGSFTRPLDVHPGDTFLASYSEFGTVGCHFS